ncbi:MAG: D-alanyl-D-alanine carboxypeptidase family protein [Candidatus Spyradocola sp.]|nr:D-alanyl-D-alanine carboxypeptidase family protein [Candidatus Spyradocola sp.]
MTNIKNKLKIMLALALVLVMLPQVCFAESYKASPNRDPESYSSSRPDKLNGDMLVATSAVAVDAGTGRVLFSKLPDRKIYPASTTKVLTALLALEHLELDEVVTVSRNCMVGESSIYLEEGEKITVEDLLYGLLLKSGNDAAVALAEAVAGSVSDFAQMMNERAEELGCENSHFANPHGLPNDDHYTTAADYAKVVMAASQYEEFMRIVGTHKYTLHIEKPDGSTREYTVTNTNKLLPDSGEEYAYEYMLGGKTGYTDAAQNAFVGISEKDGMRVVTVVFGSLQEDKWLDTQRLANYAFAVYQPLDLISICAENPITVQVENANDPENAELSLTTEGNSAITPLVSDAELADIRENFSQYTSVTYKDGTVTAPVQQGDIVGQLHFHYEGMDEIVLDLAAERTIAAVIASSEPTQTIAPNSTSDSGVRVITSDVNTGGWSPLYLLVIIPVVLFFILVVWLIVEIRRARVAKREAERRRRTEEVKRRRAQRDAAHMQATPLPRSQRYEQDRPRRETDPRTTRGGSSGVTRTRRGK